MRFGEHRVGRFTIKTSTNGITTQSTIYGTEAKWVYAAFFGMLCDIDAEEHARLLETRARTRDLDSVRPGC